MADYNGSKTATVGHSDGNQLERAKSKISVHGVLQYCEHLELLSPEEQAREECIANFINTVDRDGNGEIDSQELYLAMRDFYSNAITANEESRRASRKIQKYKRTIGGLIAAMALLIATIFGTSMAAAYLAKDTEVQNRALLTKDGQPVGINLNEMQIPVASLAFMPSIVASKVHELILSDDDGNTYHRIKQDIDIAPGKSVTLRTTGGDAVSWDALAESKDTVKIVLANGKAWDQSPLCTTCNAMSVVASDSVVEALDNFYATVGSCNQDLEEEEEEEENRRLGNTFRSLKGSEPENRRLVNNRNCKMCKTKGDDGLV